MAFASISLGRRQTAPATFCSADNSSSPSGSLKFATSSQGHSNGVASYPNNVPAAGEAAIHSGAATPLITDPFFSTSCCSSTLYRLIHPAEVRRLNYVPRANGSRHTGATSLTALISIARSRARAPASWQAWLRAFATVWLTLRKALLASTYKRKAVSKSLASSALVARV